MKTFANILGSVELALGLIWFSYHGFDLSFVAFMLAALYFFIMSLREK